MRLDFERLWFYKKYDCGSVKENKNFFKVNEIIGVDESYCSEYKDCEHNWDFYDNLEEAIEKNFNNDHFCPEKQKWVRDCIGELITNEEYDNILKARRIAMEEKWRLEELERERLKAEEAEKLEIIRQENLKFYREQEKQEKLLKLKKSIKKLEKEMNVKINWEEK